MGWKNINAIIDSRLYLGTIEAAKSPRTLSERRITHIVSVGTEPIPADNPASGIRQLRIPVEDVPYADLLIHLPSACNFIHQAITTGGVVLVHCVQGLSRSATVVAAYLMRTHGINATAAQEAVRKAREQVWFDGGFQVCTYLVLTKLRELTFELKEQLVIFELCRYQPGPHDGIYNNWRQRILQHIR
ncbi:hypothetical protein NLI96_g2581 [Meripilus lineatus]|uniref:Protein-tyrosine-phosphatase n=1 Tax=Meripilus lineatus TaxID=2056292 RepID=A0AAD5V8I6_9APHY|nr:hypothetical protein NLI96_g2581 [Physisporinus lineatus]